MIKKYTESEKYLSFLEGKRVAILGYNKYGKEEAAHLKKNGIPIVIGLRVQDRDEWEQAEKDGFQVMTLVEAVEQADIVQAW